METVCRPEVAHIHEDNPQGASVSSTTVINKLVVAFCLLHAAPTCTYLPAAHTGNAYLGAAGEHPSVAIFFAHADVRAKSQKQQSSRQCL